MKKKILGAHPVICANMILVFTLWILSFALATMLLDLFGWKLNRSYSKQKEYRNKKKIDFICKSIITIWFLMAIVNIVSFGPLFVVYHILQNIFYVVFTLLLIVFWLKRSYRQNKGARNFMIVVSVWNILIYFLFACYLLFMKKR
jgi:hypothetical protein